MIQLWLTEDLILKKDLIVRGVRLNIPPFLKGKEQFDEPEIITTRLWAVWLAMSPWSLQASAHLATARSLPPESS